MMRFEKTVLLLAALLTLGGCVGVTQTIETPAPVPTTSMPPTSIPTGAPTAPLPTVTRSPQSTPQGGIVITDPTLATLVAQAQADLARRANVPVEEITVVSAEPVEWRDSSLGCPQPGMMYTQVITPGYKIVLEANGNEYNYHASTTRVVYCEN